MNDDLYTKVVFGEHGISEVMVCYYAELHFFRNPQVCNLLFTFFQAREGIFEKDSGVISHFI